MGQDVPAYPGVDFFTIQCGLNEISIKLQTSFLTREPSFVIENTGGHYIPLAIEEMIFIYSCMLTNTRRMAIQVFHSRTIKCFTVGENFGMCFIHEGGEDVHVWIPHASLKRVTQKLLCHFGHISRMCLRTLKCQ